MLLAEKLKDYKIILGSRSPRRRELMSGAGIEYTLADGYEVEELYPKTMKAEKVPTYLAELKADGYPGLLGENEILITADTVVISDSEVLGKPDGREGAMDMLHRLSGSRHTVITGVCIRSKEKTAIFSSSSDVWFRRVTDEEIAYYVDNFEPWDKAGAYGIQEWIGFVAIERIDGSFYNVMGLPIQQLYVKLNKFISE